MTEDRTTRSDFATTSYVALDGPKRGALELRGSTRSVSGGVLAVLVLVSLASLLVTIVAGAFTGGAALWGVLTPFVVGVVAFAVNEACADVD
jgi:hypothetical protein